MLHLRYLGDFLDLFLWLLFLLLFSSVFIVIISIK
jgi:hypothetical protein